MKTQSFIDYSTLVNEFNIAVFIALINDSIIYYDEVIQF